MRDDAGPHVYCSAATVAGIVAGSCSSSGEGAAELACRRVWARQAERLAALASAEEGRPGTRRTPAEGGSHTHPDPDRSHLGRSHLGRSHLGRSHLGRSRSHPGRSRILLQVAAAYRARV
jgi:hypothetical protein